MFAVVRKHSVSSRTLRVLAQLLETDKEGNPASLPEDKAGMAGGSKSPLTFLGRALPGLLLCPSLYGSNHL